MSNVSNQIVTVAVFTFNSKKTVIETLASILAQESSGIELIVADDCSTDGTQDVVREWVDKNSSAFFACHTLFNPVNQGICQNVKRAFSRASGEWIKPIAGDDILLPSAIASLRKICEQAAPDVGVVIGRVQNFSTAIDGSHAHGNIHPTAEVADELNLPPELLVGRLIRFNTIPAPGVFIRRSAFEACGGVDESLTHLDDWPLWINMLEHGLRFQAVDNVIVGYRVHAGSISAKRSAATIDSRYLRDLISFYHRYQRRYFSSLERIDKSIYALRWQLALKPFRNRPSAYTATIVLHAFSPLRWKKALGLTKTS